MILKIDRLDMQCEIGIKQSILFMLKLMLHIPSFHTYYIKCQVLNVFKVVYVVSYINNIISLLCF